MTDTIPASSAPEAPAAARPSPLQIAQRTALPLFLFSFVLSAALVASHMWLLPTLTAVEVAGEEQNVSELRARVDQLEAEIAVHEQTRNKFILPLDDTPYRELLDAKLTATTLNEFRAEFARLAAATVPENPGAVQIHRIHINRSTKEVKLEGDVHGVGPRSMTILAQFVETVRADPRVQDLITPRFIREEDPKIGFHSPFTLAFKLP